MYRILTFFFICCFILLSSYPPLGDVSEKGGEGTEVAEKNASMEMLLSIVELETNLKQRLGVKKKELSKSNSDTENNTLKLELDELGKQLNENETLPRVSMLNFLRKQNPSRLTGRMRCSP